MPSFLNTRFYPLFKSKASSKKKPVDRFIEAIKQEYQRLKKEFPAAYKPLLARVSSTDILGILKWLIDHPDDLKNLSPDNPLRIEAAKPGRTLDYRFPITIHLIMDSAGDVELVYDPNSKLPRVFGSPLVKKDPEVKDGEKPLKLRGCGNQKKVRDTWSFHAATAQLEPSVASVVTGKKALAAFEKGKALYQAENPFLLPVSYGARYIGHSQNDQKQLKAVSFAPRAQGELLDLINQLEEIKPDLADILWICYAAARGLALFHLGGRLHRDVKAENFLFLRNQVGITVYLNDWDYGLETKKAHLTSTEAGSPLYTAFDRSCFNELLQQHNQAVREIAWFKTPTAERSYKTGRMKEKYRSLYRYYTFCQYPKTSKRQDPFKAYMKWRTQAAAQTVREASPDFEYVINIILNKRESIPLNTPNHEKDDAWGLYLTLWYLLGAFKACQGYQSDSKPVPSILDNIDGLITHNLHAVRGERLSIIEFCVELENRVRQMMKTPMAGLDETERKACVRKFSAQLQQYKVKIAGIPEVPSPLSSPLSSPCSFRSSLSGSGSSWDVSEETNGTESDSSDESETSGTVAESVSTSEKFKVSATALRQSSSSALFASRSGSTLDSPLEKTQNESYAALV